MLARVLEPEVMDTEAEARDYDAMDFAQVNRQFATEFTEVWDGRGPILDVCTGTARIPIELYRLHTELNAASGGRTAQFFGAIHITAVDLAEHMLALARWNVEAANLTDKITVVKADAKALPFPNESFGAVLCNGSIHHIPNPAECFTEMHRVCSRGGVIFVRDLLRPRHEAALANLVNLHAGGANDHQRAMFAASLRAALTVEEMRAAVMCLGYEPETVEQTSERHWTWTAIRG